MKKFLLFWTLLFSLGFFETQSIGAKECESVLECIAIKESVRKKKIDILKNQIDSLENLRNYYEGKMLRFRDRADRYQFQGNIEESEILFEQADHIEKIIKEIDQELVNLNNQLQELES